MAEKSLMTPSSASLSGLLGYGISYKVPTYQRDYSWKTENWMDLWEDLKILISTGKDHYMGAVVVQRDGDKHFFVIDGQQRFTTLSILALAVIKNIQDLIDSGIDPDDNKERISELRRGYLGQKDPGSLLYSSKLILNENNDPFYQSRLLQLSEPNNEKTLSDSDRLLWQAFNFFYSSVKSHFNNPTGEILANFLSKTLGDKMMFIKIEVEDEVSAYTLFETLNYRGVDLTVTDLLKNYLFSLLTESDIRIAKEIWKRISTSVGLDKFPIFLRHFWMSRNNLVRQEQLFKIIRASIKTNKQVFELLEKLDSSAALYVALQDPSNIEWQGNREMFKRVREFKLFGVKQHLPLLLISKEKFESQEFEKLVRLISIISFRYNVIGSRQANTMEEIYNKASIKISNGIITTALQIFNELKELYVSDEDFKNDFSTLNLYSYGRNKKLARYILFEIENHLKQGGDDDFEFNPATIEHILPENPSENWETFFPKIVQEKYIYRIGNYLLLEERLNQDAETKLIEGKKDEYLKSNYKMANEFDYDVWTPEKLTSRQNSLAKKAVAIWRSSYAI
ncbi:DUF262 domain-containing protein [Pedobacter insulae]|uniref:Uncharacterized conserved protein, contains ParB-like and HNH nuclease domains n=1 Tax=Pedobacter insulae TaxID=414048 RepID=A0A1I3AND5_9SPHI|nr:DUF262 domain-containing protein [Pedobacter insulae]SFH51550.1 Uncharacterized conserved protein, contains ParB-like and HNH nuclease domains [Pedobacter insulae]